MSNNEMMEFMKHSLELFGGISCSDENKEKIIKRIVFDSMPNKNINMQRIREAIIQNGEVLDVNEEQKLYVASIRTGVMNAASALVVVKICENSVEFASYAREGLIKQNLAQKAIDSLKAKIPITG